MYLEHLWICCPCGVLDPSQGCWGTAVSLGVNLERFLAMPSTQCLIGLQLGRHCFHPHLELYLGADRGVSNKYLGKRWNTSDSYLRNNWSDGRGTRVQFKARLPCFLLQQSHLLCGPLFPWVRSKMAGLFPSHSHVCDWSESGEHRSRSTMLS